MLCDSGNLPLSQKLRLLQRKIKVGADELSNSAFVAPKANVESVAKSETPVTANLRKPDSVAIQVGASPALGHQEDAFPWQRISITKRLDFVQIRGPGDHELEPCLW